MNTGQTVAIISDTAGLQFFGTIVAVGVLSHCSYGERCYRIGEDGSMFYMKPDSLTGQRYKVDDKTFWILEVKNPHA